MPAMNTRIGVITSLQAVGPSFAGLADLKLSVCQLVGWDPSIWSDTLAERIKAEALNAGVRVTAFWAGWSGPATWDFMAGPTTLGIVPKKHRRKRVEELKRGADFAHAIGLPAIITHLGFIPEQPSDAAFGEVVEAVREIAIHLERLGMEFWFETGQETPVTMLRLIRSVGTDNLGINLDPANLILYGKVNPVDSLEVFGSLVRNIHAKDGLYPTDPMLLGREVKVGEGLVCFPKLVHRLAEMGFSGELIIEREIAGEEQRRDIEETIGYLELLLAKEGA
jgi:L-ribulose-5-phosphate 3-epimerase